MDLLFSKKFKLLISIVTLLFLSSCHSRYISLRNDICEYPVWNNTKTAVAFVALQNASRAPVGIAKFPDGGRSKSEYSSLALYSFDIKSGKLTKLSEFKNLTDKYYTPFCNTYRVKLAFIDSLIYYNIDLSNWHGIDSITKAKYSRPYTLNINTKNIQSIDTSQFLAIYRKNKKSNAISFNELKKLLSKVSSVEWGLILKDIYPMSNKEYVKYIIYRKGSKLTRDCIFEQIAPAFSKKEIEDILGMMEKYRNELYEKYKKNNDGPYQESLKRIQHERYTNYIKETRKRLKDYH